MPRVLSEMLAYRLCSYELVSAAAAKSGHTACFVSFPCHNEANPSKLKQEQIHIHPLLFAVFYCLLYVDPLYRWQSPCLPGVRICINLHQSPSGP